MSHDYQVEWTVTGRNDLRELINYIAENNLDVALTILDKIEKRASDLWRFPERGRIVPELNDIGIIQVREVIESPWRIIYKITQSKVSILAVFDGRRNLEDVLLERFRIFK